MSASTAEAPSARSRPSLKVGIVGVGRMGAFHAHTLRRLSPISTFLLYDRDPQSTGRVAEQVGGRACLSMEEVVGEADAIVVATPATERVPVLTAAITRGVPTFCEKPFAASPEEARALAELADRHATPVQVGFQRRFDPEYRMLRQLVEAGTIGDVLMIRGTAFDHRPPSSGYQATAGDIFTDCLIHDIDAVRWIANDEVVAVQANRHPTDLPGDGAGGPGTTVATLVLTLAGGAMAVLTASRWDPRGYDHRMEVLGTRDSVAAGLNDTTPLRMLQVRRLTGNTQVVRAQPTERNPIVDFTGRFSIAYAEEMRAFVHLATNGGPSVCEPADAVRAQEIAAAAGESARTGRRTDLPLAAHAT